MMSFSASGIPCNGPRHSPRRASVSAWRASLMAESAVTVMNAFNVGLSFSIAARDACVSSTGDTPPRRICCEVSAIPMWELSGQKYTCGVVFFAWFPAILCDLRGKEKLNRKEREGNRKGREAILRTRLSYCELFGRLNHNATTGL